MSLETGNYIANLVAANPPGTDPKSQGDDHLRLIKNALLNCFAGFVGGIMVTGTDGGAANAYTLTPAPALIGYTARMIAVFSPTVANTGASTINISGLGVRNILSVSGANLTAGDLAVGTIYAAAYDGAAFRLLSITKNYADQLSFSGVLPAQPGNADKFITTNGSVASWSDLIKVGTMKFADSADTTKRVQFDLSGLTTGQTRVYKFPDAGGYINGGNRSARTTNTILGINDAGSEIVITGAGGFTQTLTAAATLGAGWKLRYWNFSTGNITFDPNSSENIDGAATGILEPGMGIDIFCDATQFNCERVGPPITKILTSGTSGTFPLGVRLATSEQCGGGGSGGRETVGSATYAGANSGAWARKQWNVSPNTGYTYAIGAGATGGTTTGAGGAAGGATTLTVSGVTVTTNGGSAGPASQIPLTTRNTATNGDINVDSGLGKVQNISANALSYGGDTPMGWGEGGVYIPGTNTGVAPSGAGAGGAAGDTESNGQNGLPGKIHWYY